MAKIKATKIITRLEVVAIPFSYGSFCYRTRKDGNDNSWTNKVAIPCSYGSCCYEGTFTLEVPVPDTIIVAIPFSYGSCCYKMAKLEKITTEGPGMLQSHFLMGVVAT